MRIAQTTLAVLLLLGLASSAQVPGPAPQQVPPATQVPPVAPPPVAPVPPPAAGAPVVPPPLLGTRTFAAKTGMIFQSVRPERVTDFETVIGYLKTAIEQSTDPAVRAQ